MLPRKSDSQDKKLNGSPESVHQARSPGRWVLIASILGSAMAFINVSVVNVALPAIQTDLSASVSDMQWILNGYSLILGAFILAGGSAGDHYGRKKVFVAGIVLFAVASVGCGLAQDVVQLVAGRILQGAGGALLIPGSLSMISSAFAAGERGKAIGTWSGFSAITTAVGPVIGGWLLDEFSWRPVFYINIPLAVAALYITVRFVPETRGRGTPGGLDWWGVFLATAGLGALSFGLIEASEKSLGDPLILSTLAGGLILTGIFVIVEYKQSHPMMPLHLFKSRTFSGANLLTLLLYFALSGMFFFLPFHLIQVRGYSATAAGAAFLPFTLLMGILSRWSGGLTGRYGSQLPLIVGPVIAAAGFILLGLPEKGGTYWTDFFPGMTVLGLGMAVSVAPLTTTVMGAVPVDDAGIASGVNNAVSRIAGMLAVAVLGVVMITVFSQRLGEMMANNGVSSVVQARIMAESENLAAIRVPGDLEPPLKQCLSNLIKDSFLAGFRFIMFLSAGLAVLSALVSRLLITTERDRSLENHPTHS